MKRFNSISISLSPNVEKDDVKLALNLIIRPWLWLNGKGTKELEESFRNYLGVKYAFSFNSGRSALYAILKSLSPKKNSKAFLQAFTCNASINPFLWAGLKPIYVDCNGNDFNIDIEDLRKKIAENSDARILMVQHTFGMPAKMDEIVLLAKQNGLVLIEDCAHSLGAKYDNQSVGKFGKASFFSFSRDKIISSVYGGMAITNNENIAEKLRDAQSEFKMPSALWVFQQLLHPILLYYIILPIYHFFNLGKIILIFSQIFHVLSKAVSKEEKKGLKPNYFPNAMPNALAILAMNQLKKIEKFNAHRQKVADFYFKNLDAKKFDLPKQFSNRKSAFLRFTVKHLNAHEIIYQSWHKENMLLGDWYTTPIAPFDTNLSQMHYKKGICPVAEYLSEKTFNLPTHINIKESDAKRIVNFLNNFKKTKIVNGN